MNTKFTNRQLCLILYCVTVGYGVMNLPKTAAEVAGTSGWVSIAIATLIYSVIITIIFYLQYSFENKIVYDYSLQLVGKPITLIFTALWIADIFITFAFLPRVYCNAINLTILDKTPVRYLALLFFLVIGYAMSKGLKTISRLVEIYATLSILNFILINAILCTQGKLINIKPIFTLSEFPLYLKGVFKMILPILGGEALFFIPMNQKENRKICKYGFITFLLIGLFYIFIIESTISVVGVDTVIYSRTTLFSTIRGLDIPYFDFFKRLDGYYIMIWSLNLICTCSIWGYGLVIFIRKIFKDFKYKYTVIAVGVIGYIVSLLPKTIAQTEKILDMSVYVSCGIYLIVPITLLTVKKVKKL